jgi:hypothetical protein
MPGIRLAKKRASDAKLSPVGFGVTGRNNNADRRPTPLNRGRERHAAHGAGRIDIREYSANIGAIFQDPHRLVRIGCCDGFEARRLDEFHRHHELKRFVFNDEDDGFLIARMSGHGFQAPV